MTAMARGTTFMKSNESLGENSAVSPRYETEPSTPAPPVPDAHRVMTLLQGTEE